MKCLHCGKDFLCIKKYILHIEYMHDKTNYYKCPFNNCHRLYNRRDTFKKHVASKHSEPVSKMAPPVVESFKNESPCSSKGLTENDRQNEATDHSQPSKDNFEISCKIEEFAHTSHRTVKKVVAILYDDLQLNRSMVQRIIEIITLFLKSGMLDIIKLCCTQLTIDNNSDIINGIIKMADILENSFQPVNTEYKRFKLFENCKTFIKPIEKVLGITHNQQHQNNSKILALKNHCAYFIPMRHTLKTFLEIPGVFNAIIKHQQELLNCFDKLNPCMTSVLHGSLWQNITKGFSKNQIVFPLVIYFDDFESLNPLGSHAGLYKIGSVYFSIAAVPPEYASRLENIFLALIFYSGDRIKFGNKNTFDLVIQELLFLEINGLNIATGEGQSINIKFCLVSVTGDNLGVHSIVGLNESFGSTYYCRFCTVLKGDMHTQTTEDSKNLRVKEKYDEDLASKRGIKEPCIWNQLPNFHVYENICCDIMHDVFEGVLRYDMSVIIYQLVEAKCFTVERLNSRIKYFTYNNTEKNICPGINPNHLSNDGCIIMSAAEMLCLTRNFSFIIGDLVPIGSKVWEFYLIVLEMVHILTSKVFTNSILEHLASLIQEHNKQYMDISKQNLKPKFHFLLHYPRIISKIGPPIFFSCMRFEAKHKDFKRVCHSITCRKNLPLSLASRNQLKYCYRLISSQGFNDKVDLGKINQINSDKQLLFEKNNLMYDHFFCTHFYEINGIRYEINAVFLYKIENDVPVFCQIKDIFINKNCSLQVYFSCLLLETSSYYEHFYAFKIRVTDNIRLLNAENISSEFPTILHEIKNDFLVTKLCTA